MLVVNKVDSFEKFMPDVYEFYNLGIGDPIPISAASRLGIGDLLDEVIAAFSGTYQERSRKMTRPQYCYCGKAKCRKIFDYQQAFSEKIV